jgi:WD40 repeat protein
MIAAAATRFDRKYELRKHYRAIFTPDGKSLLVTGAADSIVLLNAATGNEERRLKGHRQSSRGLGIMADGKTVVSGTEGGDILLHRLDTGELLREIRSTPRKGAISRTLNLSPDEKSVVISGNYGVERIELATGTPQSLLRGSSYQSNFDREGNAVWAQIYGNGIWRIALDARQAESMLPERSGGLLVQRANNLAIFIRETEDPQVEVLDLKNGKVVRTFPVPHGKLHTAEFSHNGRFLAVTSLDRPIRIYDFAAGKEILQIPFVNPIELTSLDFSPDGQQLAALNGAGRIAVWNLPTGLGTPSAK